MTTYGYSGFGLTPSGATSAAVALPIAKPSATRFTLMTPWDMATTRLRTKLQADSTGDPVGLCGQNIWAASCGAKQVAAESSPWRKAVRAEMSAIYQSGGSSASSMLAYTLANMVAQVTDMAAQTAMLAMRYDHLKATGGYPVSADKAAAGTRSATPTLSTAQIYGGAAAPNADTPSTIGPAQPTQTATPPGPTSGGYAPMADEEQAITGGGGQTPQDVLLPVDEPPSVIYETPPVVGPAEKKPIWPWLLVGLVVAGGVGYAVRKKKRKR